MSDTSDAALERAGPLVAWQLLRHVVDDLVGVTAVFGTDLEALLVWAVLGCESLAPASSPAAPRDAASAKAASGVRGAPRADRARPRPVRIRDLARITGIPRETVRRKLLALEAAGRAERVVHGWVATRCDEDELRRLADAAMHRLRDTCEAVRRYSSASGAISA